MFQSLFPKNVLCHHAETADIKVKAEAEAVAEAAAIKATVLHQHAHLQAVEQAQAQAVAVKAEAVADVQDVQLAAANLNTDYFKGVCRTGNCLGMRPFLLSKFHVQLDETFHWVNRIMNRET